MVRQPIQLHGGTVRHASSVSEGARFIIMVQVCSLQAMVIALRCGLVPKPEVSP